MGILISILMFICITATTHPEALSIQNTENIIFILCFIAIILVGLLNVVIYSGKITMEMQKQKDCNSDN